MQTIGERLEEARKRKGISVREAAETTKIRSDYLQKFESNSFDLDLPPLYVRGFVRGYARYLDLDPERFVDEFDSLMTTEGRAPKREAREVYGRVDFTESTEGAARPAMDQALMLKYGLFGGGAILVIALIVLLISVFSTHTTVKPAATRDAAPPAAAVDSAQTLTFTASDTTRLKVVEENSGTVLFNGALTRGETKSFHTAVSVLITVEDRTKLRMEINGRAQDIPQFATGNYGKFRVN